MDFVSRLPITPRKNDAVWVIVDRLTKSAHFILVRKSMSSDILADLYIREVIRLHGVPISIVSDRDPNFTSRFWKCLQKALGSILNLSMAFHLNWEKSIPLVEFAYNNSYQTSIRMVPFEALYGRRCTTPICVGTSYVKSRRNGIIKFYVPLEIHVQIPKTGGRVKRLTMSSLISSKYSLDAPHELTIKLICKAPRSNCQATKRTPSLSVNRRKCTKQKPEKNHNFDFL
ncbi:hypothetical protein V6N12_033012 [Hibiscus sabdariffa]|uniref:Integrase catalytic domain-containing protein n=1 Tax=Hibiscus sabdariffa TaxID=183260 RepID=A0ABR2CEQ6_9ROSI